VTRVTSVTSVTNVTRVTHVTRATRVTVFEKMTHCGALCNTVVVNYGLYPCHVV
jgi:hypothetical protein